MLIYFKDWFYQSEKGRLLPTNSVLPSHTGLVVHRGGSQSTNNRRIRFRNDRTYCGTRHWKVYWFHNKQCVHAWLPYWLAPIDMQTLSWGKIDLMTSHWRQLAVDSFSCHFVQHFKVLHRALKELWVNSMNNYRRYSWNMSTVSVKWPIQRCLDVVIVFVYHQHHSCIQTSWRSTQLSNRRLITHHELPPFEDFEMHVFEFLNPS